MTIRQWCVVNNVHSGGCCSPLNPLFTGFVSFHKITFSGVLTTFEELMQTCFRTENYLPGKDVIFRKWWGKGYSVLYTREIVMFSVVGLKTFFFFPPILFFLLIIDALFDLFRKTNEKFKINRFSSDFFEKDVYFFMSRMTNLTSEKSSILFLLAFKWVEECGKGAWKKRKEKVGVLREIWQGRAILRSQNPWFHKLNFFFFKFKIF